MVCDEICISNFHTHHCPVVRQFQWVIFVLVLVLTGYIIGYVVLWCHWVCGTRVVGYVVSLGTWWGCNVVMVPVHRVTLVVIRMTLSGMQQSRLDPLQFTTLAQGGSLVFKVQKLWHSAHQQAGQSQRLLGRCFFD